MAKHCRLTERVLAEIAKPPTTVGLIAAALRVTRPSVERVIVWGLKYGYIEKEPDEPGYGQSYSLAQSGRDRLFGDADDPLIRAVRAPHREAR